MLSTESVSARFRHLLDHIVDVELGRLLTHRELREGLVEVSDNSLGRHEQVNSLDQPAVVVVRVRVGALERIGSQVEYFGDPQCHERFNPDHHLPGLLLGEDDLPLLITHADQLAVVTPIKELLARSFFCSILPAKLYQRASL
jgi:hypothetical protein